MSRKISKDLGMTRSIYYKKKWWDTDNDSADITLAM